MEQLFPDSKFSIKGMLKLNFDRMTAAQESCGYKFTSYSGNMSTYIFIVMLAVCIAVGLTILIFLCCGFRRSIRTEI